MTTPCRRAEVIKEDRTDPGAEEYVPIRIVNMTGRHARLWDFTFGRRILVGSEPRADRFWPWTFARVVGPLWQQQKGYRCRAYCVLQDVLRPGTQLRVELPVGMMLFIEQYPHLVPSSEGTGSTFAWLLAAAPKEAMKEVGISKRPSLGRVLVDTALGHSTNSGLQGRIWLHCAPAGGDRLMGFYRNHGKLLNLPQAEELPVNKRNDGRYFYSTESLADQLLMDLQSLRI